MYLVSVCINVVIALMVAECIHVSITLIIIKCVIDVSFLVVGENGDGSFHYGLLQPSVLIPSDYILANGAPADHFLGVLGTMNL